MAGDHKCPVCQSTFTRPQHVARHMRSHTGDRPYKCQHCGDQFARSDLLSRHVNKCHASEKPPTTTAPNRRKGAAAASRATTSKQACDQCVQSSLPCDGSNPCSKCIQRKCRCTYVKFHRQTAPQGPGHPVPNLAPPQARHSLSLGARPLDDFVLAPPSAAYGFPSMYASAPSGSEYALPPGPSSMYPHGYQSADPRDDPAPSLTLPAGTRDTINTSPDVMARYRAQAELLSRAGVLPNGSLVPSVAPGASDGALPSLYAEPQSQYPRYANNLPLAQSSSWAHSHDANQQQQYAVDDHRKEYDAQYVPGRHAFPAGRDGESALAHNPSAHGSAFPPLSSAAAGDAYHSSGVPFHHEDLNDDFGSDGGSGPSHSIPSSANSSNVHLPLVDHHRRSQQHSYSPTAFPHLGGPANTHYHAKGSNKNNFEPGAHNNDSQGEGGFSSAFGLMSLDDPNVLAGLSADSAPFFSNVANGSGANNGSNGFNMPTPTQDFIAALKTGKSDSESREMRDFWKMYMRTPLSGPGGANMLSLTTPTGPGQMLGAARPSPSRKHSRVASLPSMKTPPLHMDTGAPFPPPRLNINLNHAASAQGGNGNTFSSMRTTLHDAEDLKSYEQAVLARRAPMTLNLVPKRKSTLPSQPNASEGGQRQNSGASKSASPVLPPPTFVPNKITDLLNRPSSSASATSSLAHAFGSAENLVHGQQPLRMSTQGGQQSMRAPSSGSGVGSDDAGTDSDGASPYRPSFKRLASQTLGPENSKRALLGPAGWEDDEGADEADGDDEDDDELTSTKGRMGSQGADAGRPRQFMDRPMVNLSDRHRRMSAPNAPTLTTAVGVMHGGGVQSMTRAEDNLAVRYP